MALPKETTLKPTVPPGPGPRPGPQPSSAGKWIGVLLVFALLAGVVVWRQHATKAAEEKKKGGPGRGEMPPVPVVAGVVTAKDVPIYLDGLGIVQAFNTVTVRARVDGQLEKVAFTEGQDVRAGDLLAQIDPAPFRTALEQAQAKEGQDAAQLTNAKVDLQRYADLLAHEGVTQQVYDTQKALVNQLEAAVKADQAAVENTRVQLGYTTITSPIDGRTGIRLVDQGNMIRANDTTGLVVITQLKPISVVITLPQKTLSQIREAQEAGSADLAVLALKPDNTTVLAEGKLAVIDNQIDSTTGTIKLKATFPNTDLHLWPGQFVNARVRLQVRKDSLVVPASVVQRGPEGAFAFVINDDQSVDTRPVRVGQIEQGEALIEAGLHPGERVVVDGQYKLQKGSRVRSSEAGGARGGDAETGGQPGRPGGPKGAEGHRGSKKAAQP